jgi:hypothetical protein
MFGGRLSCVSLEAAARAFGHLPIPNGVTKPSPVTTTLRIACRLQVLMQNVRRVVVETQSEFGSCTSHKWLCLSC